MKKTTALFITVIMMFGLCACSKTADPINLPTTDEITSIEISDTEGNLQGSITEAKQIKKFVAEISGAKATNKSTVQDMPNVDDYYKADITCGEKITTIFFYEENEKHYVEQPYQGVYEMNTSLQELLDDME